MTSYVAQKVAKQFFKETAANRFGQEDPYFENVPATRLGIYKTTKKQKKALPPGLTDEEARILTKVKRRAYRLDMCLFNLCGTRFGWSAIVGLVPVIGDVLDFLLAYMVYTTCDQVKPPLPSGVKRRMELNLAIDFLIGLVPFIGDIADGIYKCNTRNAVLLEKELRKRGQKRLKATNQRPPVDPSLPENFDDEQEEQFLVAQHGPPPRYTSKKEPRRPERTYGSEPARNDGGGRFGGRQDIDLEAGEAPPPKLPRRY